MFCCDAAQLLMLRDTQFQFGSDYWVGAVENVLVAIGVVGYVCPFIATEWCQKRPLPSVERSELFMSFQIACVYFVIGGYAIWLYDAIRLYDAVRIYVINISHAGDRH